MKFAFIGDNDLPSVEADSAFAKKHGFTGIEYNYWGQFKELDEKTVRKMAAIHKKHGVGVAMLGLWGWNHLSPDPKVRKEAHVMLDRAIKFAKILKADVFTTGAGDIPGEPVGRKVKEFLKVFPPFLKKMKAAGLKSSFYPMHGASFLDGLPAYERVWEHIPELTIKYDPANWKHHGDDYLEIVQRYGNKIGYVHIKEHLYKDGKLVSQPAAGMGDIEWGKVFAFLHEHGYEGWLSVEPHGLVWGRGEMRKKMILLSQRYIRQFVL
jgi:sugar phosphate isomerase/epimerase